VVLNPAARASPAPERGEPAPAWAAGRSTAPFGPHTAERVLAFHRTLPGYRSTPLHRLRGLARRLDLTGLAIKDESARLGLDSFKVLGTTWALERILSSRSGEARAPGDAESGQRGALTFVTASDGNHGRGLAWAARRLGHRAVVFLPGGTSPHRVAAVRACGARAEVIDGSYDQAVRLASRKARERGWVLVQDTSWEGYEEVPAWIMQGYLTLVHEAIGQLGEEMPTHVFVQCGVGSLAAAVLGYLVERFGDGRPRLVVVEPLAAACFLRSARSGDGSPRGVPGPHRTRMAGLACGEPGLLAWRLLRDHADAFVACDDETAVRGVGLLARPRPDDPALVSGDSGAVTLGLLARLREDRALAEAARSLGLDGGSRVLLVSTEGDTDPPSRREILEDVTQREGGSS
jgi:diaminopropionate ammonia-lyase